MWEFRSAKDADDFEEVVKRKLLLRAEVKPGGRVEEYTGISPRVSGSWRTKQKKSEVTRP